MTIQLTQEQLTELVTVLDTFVMDGIDEDNKFIEVYNTLTEQVQNWPTLGVDNSTPIQLENTILL